MTAPLTSASFGLYKSLWVTDGTGAGSVDITPDAANSAFAPNMLGHVGNYTIFQADDVAFDPSSFSLVGSHYGLWTTDGTAAGTMSIGTFQYFGGFVGFGNEAILNGSDGAGHTGIVVTDGTAAGTVLVKNINTPGTPPRSTPLPPKCLARKSVR